MLPAPRKSGVWRQGALPPPPLLFHTESVGKNVHVHGGGRGAEWVHTQHLGRCGLSKPIKKSRAVTLEVSGTGYFTLDIRSQPLTEEDIKASSKSACDRSVREINFKLKKSQLTVTVERMSHGSELIVTFCNRQGAVSTEKVKLPDQTNPWVTLDILFGSLSISCASTGKNKRDWKFQGPFGLNVVCKSKKEVCSFLSNPCAVVASERPLDRKEVTELTFVPLNRNQQSSVKVYLSNSHPSDLKLQDDLTYFDEKGVYSLLQLVYQLRKFEGRIQLHLHESKEQMELRLYEKKNGKGTECYSTHLVPVIGNHIDERKPVFLCLELFRVKVDISSVFLFSKSWEESGYATVISSDEAVRERVSAEQRPLGSQTQGKDESALYLTPLPAEAFPDLPRGSHSSTASSSEAGITTTAVVHSHEGLSCVPFPKQKFSENFPDDDDDEDQYEHIDEGSCATDDETLVKQVWPLSSSEADRPRACASSGADKGVDECRYTCTKTLGDVMNKRRRSHSRSAASESEGGYEEPVRKLQRSTEQKNYAVFRQVSPMTQSSCQVPLTEQKDSKFEGLSLNKKERQEAHERCSLQPCGAWGRGRSRSESPVQSSNDEEGENCNLDLETVNEKIMKIIDNIQNLDEAVQRIDKQLKSMSVSAPEVSTSPQEVTTSEQFMTGFRYRLQKRFTLWVERLDPVPVADLLFQNGIISWDTLDRIQRMDLRQPQTRELLAILLQKPHAEAVFRDALHRSHQLDLLAALDDVDLDPSVALNT